MLRRRLKLMRRLLNYNSGCLEEKITVITFHQCRNPFDQYFNAGCIRVKACQYNLTNFKTRWLYSMAISGIS
jgi:hypothetical protein